MYRVVEIDVFFDSKELLTQLCRLLHCRNVQSVFCRQEVPHFAELGDDDGWELLC